MEATKSKLYETDLYKPVKEYFIKHGYNVKGEVNDCDVTAVKGEDLVIIELKLTLNLDVILQATLRQKISDIVYIAVPKKTKILRTKRYKNIIYLLRRLRLGLLFVNFNKNKCNVEEILCPQPFNMLLSKRYSNKKRDRVLKEFKDRHGDYNTGGCSKKKIITAYRQKSIHIAVLLKDKGPLKINELRLYGTDKDKTASILQKNYYGWFERISRGIYKITDKGIKDLKDYTKLYDIKNFI